MNGNHWVVGEMYKLQNVFHFHIFFFLPFLIDLIKKEIFLSCDDHDDDD